MKLLERATGWYLVKFVKRATKAAVAQALIEMLSPSEEFVPKITHCSGLEFVAHQRVNQALGCRSFFADPYRSQRCASHENANGLLRQDFGKKMKLSAQNTAQLPQVVAQLHNRPSKRDN